MFDVSRNWLFYFVFVCEVFCERRCEHFTNSKTLRQRPPTAGAGSYTVTRVKFEHLFDVDTPNMFVDANTLDTQASIDFLICICKRVIYIYIYVYTYIYTYQYFHMVVMYTFIILFIYKHKNEHIFTFIFIYIYIYI